MSRTSRIARRKYIQVALRWIWKRQRNVRCFSFTELNGHIRMLPEEPNHRQRPGYRRSRWELLWVGHPNAVSAAWSGN